MAASPEVPLLHRLWPPGAVVGRAQQTFTVGLLGAVLAIVSAMILAIDLERRVRRMTLPDIAAIFAVTLLAVVVCYIVLASYNAVVALRLRIDKAWANIGVVLRQRHDQLPNLVAAVRGLMAYERDVLIRVTEARAAYAPTAPIPDQAATSEATTAAVRSLFAVVERYPDIKAAANVQDLQDEIERLEGMIADRRELYNDQVYRYNTRIGQVPGSSWRRSSAGSRASSSRSTRRTPSRPTPTFDRSWHGRTMSGWSATARPSGRASDGTPGGRTSR